MTDWIMQLEGQMDFDEADDADWDALERGYIPGCSHVAFELGFDKVEISIFVWFWCKFREVFAMTRYGNPFLRRVLLRGQGGDIVSQRTMARQRAKLRPRGGPGVKAGRRQGSSQSISRQVGRHV